jgi:acyl transferase domain-containing protein
MVVLKRLSKAIEDDDTIRAVIRGTSSNQDGRTPSITQPSSSAQESLIRQAYKNAGLGFHSTHYLEAHGTGTPAGDPVEVDGVGRVFSSHKSPQRPLYVGSVKANIGHLESAAGVAGLIKTVLALERGVVPPNAMLESLNPAIKADALHLSVGLLESLTPI